MEAYRRSGKHLPLNTLKQELQNKKINNDYIYKSIPTYPRPELHVSRVSHSTDLKGLRGIKKDGGFRNPKDNQKENKMIWFSLTVSPDELRDAETREMKLVRPGGREEPLTPQDLAEAQTGMTLSERGILQKFASSPAFKSSSRYGSFRFTFSLRDVLEKYKQQLCDGQEPVLRVYHTVLYKQEVMYAVLVHGPEHNSKFSEFPLLEETPHCICAFRAEPGPHFVWRPQAMSETHRFELQVAQGGNMSSKEIDDHRNQQFYVWDHVALALHVDDQVLEFEDRELREHLRFCDRDPRPVNDDIQYQRLKTARLKVMTLWPLKKFSQSHICPRGSGCKLPSRCIC